MSCGSAPQVYGQARLRVCPTSSCCKKSTFQQTVTCCPEPASTGEWIEYTPVITGGTPATDAIIEGRYKIIDKKTAIVKFNFSQTNNTGAAAGNPTYFVSLPEELYAYLFNVGVGESVGSVIILDNTNVQILVGSVFLFETGFTIIAGNSAIPTGFWGSGLVPLSTASMLVTATLTFELV